MCVVSALMAALVILASVVAEIVLYYMKSEWLMMWSTATNVTNNIENPNIDTILSAVFNDTFMPSNETTTTPDTVSNITETVFDIAQQNVITGGISLHDTIFLAFISIVGIFAAITVGLLLHLCFFHVYISFLGLTTYEYIRNQRQSDQKPSTDTKKINSIQTTNKTTLNALKKSSVGTQIYFCSAIDPKNLVENYDRKGKHCPKVIHCCDTSMQYMSTSHKAFYLCSSLHDRPSPILVPSSMAHELTANSSSTSRSKTFHCCSKYKQIIKATANGQRNYNDETHQTESITESITENDVQFSEQCTFCSFKLNTMKRSKVDAERQFSQRNKKPDERRPQQRTDTSQTPSTPRSKRAWNCCSNVPESPDAPPTDNALVETVSASVQEIENQKLKSQQHLHHHHYHHRLRGAYDDNSKLHQNNGSKSINGSSKPSMQPKSVRPVLSSNLKNSKRKRQKPQSAWPIRRLRYMFRVFGRCRQPNCQQPNLNSNNNKIQRNKQQPHQQQSQRTPPVNIKQNKIRPIDMMEQQYGELQEQRRHVCQQQPQQQQTYYDYQNVPMNFHKTNTALTTTSTISSENDDDSLNAHLQGNEVTTITINPPPPPVRRKVIDCASADIQKLAESLSFVQNPSHHHHHYSSKLNKQQQYHGKNQRSVLTSGNNRRRRKNVFRTRSPNLSPIHESEFSNPTSPQPTRHSTTHENGLN